MDNLKMKNKNEGDYRLMTNAFIIIWCILSIVYEKIMVVLCGILLIVSVILLIGGTIDACIEEYKEHQRWLYTQ